MSGSHHETTGDSAFEWFHCPTCDQEFGDPHAEEKDGRMVGKCGKCGTTVNKPLEEADS